MPKDYFQDITPPTSSKMDPVKEERTIRNIPIAPRRERGPNFPTVESADNSFNAPASARESVTPPGRKFRLPPKNIIMWGVAVLAVLGLVLVAFAMFQGTSVVVTPRTHVVVLTEDVPMTAYETGDSHATAGALTYETVERSYDGEKTIEAHGFTEVQEYASGVVTVYNNHGTSPIRLIKNTRFEGPGGLIFRIHDSIVVSGKKGDAPGTATVTVYADEAGDKYNLGPIDKFTLPGLKGGDMYSDVYARSAVAFRGGFVGSKPKVADADLESARSVLRSSLEQRARSEIATLSVTGKLVFPQLMSIMFESLPFETSSDGKALLHERAQVKVPIFPDTAFAKELAISTRADTPDGTVQIQKLDGIKIRTASGIVPSQNAPLDLLVSGNATLIWDVDADELTKVLAGSSKAEAVFDKIIGGISSIEKADAFIRPFWRDSFPSDPSKIKVVIKEAAKQ